MSDKKPAPTPPRAPLVLPPNFVDKTAGTVIGIIGASGAGKAPKVPPDRV